MSKLLLVYPPLAAGIGPYMALELTSYDLLPQELPSFARGFAAAFIATVTCYPLDTIRRHIQLQVGGQGAGARGRGQCTASRAVHSLHATETGS